MIKRHPTYWFNDGDTILHQKVLSDHDDNDIFYRIHHSRFSWPESPKFLPGSSSQLVSELGSYISDNDQNTFRTMGENDSDEELLDGLNGCKYVVLDHEQAIDANDLVVLLDHFYGKNVLSPESDLTTRIVPILRITSLDQLNIPTLHEEAKKSFVRSFPNNAQELANFQGECAEEALAVAIQYDIRQPQKPLLYYLATQTHLELHEADSQDSRTSISTLSHTISTHMISLFTPLLFTPPPTSHMECTDALAEHWMPLVIAPAIEDSAMGKPLQTLERMKDVNWSECGLCEECVRIKREEWTEEQDRVWKIMDTWILEADAKE
ncbi:hypothetical protein C8R41DRAFT_917683 [Lentinula lateritia]|uniref:BTB domain-containing protein n=1 Tax=Lentinula lateritia TaxID=40482 RepID=A0ABQ8VLP9_9AGAR|nr:hypothetical protein C8R41DRAFT_917683 [Lentinula lateritia]